MKLASKILFKNYTLDDWYKDLKLVLGGQRATAGVRVNEDSALRYTTVYACIRVLSETLASLPLHVYRKRSSGNGKDRATDHPLYDVLHTVPNEEMPSMTWRETMMGHILTSGNCYSEKTYNGRGAVVRLYPIPWTQMRPVRNKQTRAIEYELTDRGKVEIMPAEKVLHIPGLGFDGIVGYSPIRMAMEAIGLGLAAESFGARFFGHGTHLGGIIEHPQSMSDESFARLKKSFREEYGGLQKSHGTIILEEGAKFTKLGIPPEEAQFLETRKFQRSEIAGIYRVPPHMLADLEKATFSNIEHLSLEFLMYSMRPWIYRWEQYINWKLFSPEERKQEFFAEFAVTALLRGDTKSQAEALHIARQDGVVNADEWREMVGMNPQEGGTGKIYFINGNMVSVDKAAEQGPKQDGGTGAQPAPIPTPAPTRAKSYYSRFRPTNEKNEDKLPEVKQVIKTLSKEEKAELGPRYFYDDSQYRYIVERDDKPVGFIENRATGKKGHFNLAVDPDYRGQGIADDMVDQAIADTPAELPDIEKILWVTTEGNEASRALAEKHGFELTSEEDGEVRYTYWLTGGE